MNPERIESEAKRLAMLSAKDLGQSEETQNEVGKLVAQMGPGEYNLFLRLFSEHLRDELSKEER